MFRVEANEIIKNSSSSRANKMFRNLSKFKKLKNEKFKV